MSKSRWVLPSRIPISFGLEDRNAEKTYGTSYYCKYFFNRSQAVLLVGKMGEEARDGCKKIC